MSKIKIEYLTKNKAEFLRTFVLLFCFIFALLLTYIVGALLYTRDSIESRQTGEPMNFDEYFSDCNLLESECLDLGCKYYAQCGDGNYDVCRVYDCGDTYGVFTEDAAGKQEESKRKKPDLSAVAAKKKDCAGTMEVLSQDCVEGKEQVKVKIATQGECKIGGFTVIFEESGAESNDFTALGDDTYAITALSCGAVSQIVPATDDGVSLEF